MFESPKPRSTNLSAITAITLFVSACSPPAAPTDAGDASRGDTSIDGIATDSIVRDAPFDTSLDGADGNSLDGGGDSGPSMDAVADTETSVSDAGADEGLDATDDTVDAASDAPGEAAADVGADAPIDVPIVPACDAMGSVRIARSDFDLASGDTHAALVWVEPPSNAVRVGFVEADGSVRGAQTIATGGFPIQPHITRTTSGWAIAWNNGANVFFARVDSSLAPLDSPTPVRTVAATDYRPRIAASGDDLAIGWISEVGTDLELWMTSVSPADVIATPVRLTTAGVEVSFAVTGPASWTALFADRATGGFAETIVPYATSTGLGTPTVVAPIELTDRIAWTGSGYLATGLSGVDEYVETYSASAARLSQRHFTFAGSGSGGTIGTGALASVFDTYAHPVCLPGASGGSLISIGWFAADGSTARPEGPSIPITDATCGEPHIAAMGANYAVVGWADITVPDHDLALRVICR